MKPDKIWICGIPYRVVWCENAYDVDLDRRKMLCGQHDPWDNTIRLHDNNRPWESKFQTLWHEILHAIEQAYHISNLDDDAIDLLATGIADVIVRNGWCAGPEEPPIPGKMIPMDKL